MLFKPKRNKNIYSQCNLTMPTNFLCYKIVFLRHSNLHKQKNC
uniref:Uncharacterized protein n=1 Tax=Siphoviridae sp. ct5op20 TaxID=2826295 RepID=A0A8S5NRF3_9CAUD|nr:MAG TPA: hypothetical protein [Siphoviridae sp. ct5op20]